MLFLLEDLFFNSLYNIIIIDSKVDSLCTFTVKLLQLSRVHLMNIMRTFLEPLSRVPTIDINSKALIVEFD